MSDTKPEIARTTIASYTLAIHKALISCGHDAGDIFKAAGFEHKPGQDPLDRLSTEEVAAVFRVAVERSGNPAFGLTVARYLHPSSFHALGYALLASSTLRDACERLVYYFRIISNQGAYRIEEEGEQFRLILDVLVDGVALETVDAWNAFIVRTFRIIYKPDLTPLSVSLPRPCPAGYEQSYRDAFHVAVNFDAPYCEICLDGAVMDQPLLGANREIASQHDQIIQKYIDAMDAGDIISRVKRLILHNLPSENCTKQQIARELAMSPSTLQQKLASQDTSFQLLLNQVRESLALDYMEQSKFSITEMSFTLGFTSLSSFTRAFRRWTGKSPREYRRDIGRDD